MDTKTKIMEAVIKECKNSLIGKLSTVNVSKVAGTSESNIYKIYKTKDTLLIETFLYLDNKITKKISSNYDITGIDDFNEFAQTLYNMWRMYLEFFAKNYSYAHYYSMFRTDNKLYTPDVIRRQNSNKEKIWDFVRRLSDDNELLLNQIPFNLFWTLAIDSTLAVAQRMAKGDIELSEDNIDYTYHILFDGIFELVTAHLGL